jgi:hypothetical protein
MMFTEALILVQFNLDLKTVVETDSSSWCISGTLL